jgi:hypothetical protein
LGNTPLAQFMVQGGSHESIAGRLHKHDVAVLRRDIGRDLLPVGRELRRQLEVPFVPPAEIFAALEPSRTKAFGTVSRTVFQPLSASKREGWK